jgi:hypothetical protein
MMNLLLFESHRAVWSWEVSFFRQFREISERMSKDFGTKHTLRETAEAFAALAGQADKHKECELIAP